MKFLTLPISIIILTSTIFSQRQADLYSKAMTQFNIGDYSQAITLFYQFNYSSEINEELFASSNIYIAESYLGLEQIDAAISKFESFLTQFPTSNFRELALYRLGNLYFEKKLYDKSRERLILLIEEFPFSDYLGSAYHLIGETFIEENDLTRAEEFFSTAVSSKSNNRYVDKSIYSLANLYEKKGNYSEAVKYYDKLLGYYKNSELASLTQLRIGVCYYYLKEYDNAVLELSDPLIQELPIDEQNEADYILANAFYKLREFKSAMETYKRILSNSPSSEMLDRIRYGLAWIHFQQKKYNDAFKLFSLLADSKEDSIAVKSLFWAGEAKRYEGKYGESIEIHRRFAELYPDHPYADRVKLNIGMSKFSQQSYTESEESLLELINSGDVITKARAYTILGEINLKRENYKSASQYFERGLLLPELASELRDRCNLGLGISQFYMKRHLNAISSLNKIDDNYTKIDVGNLNFYKGEINFFLGNYSDAIINYNRINNSDPLLLKNIYYGKAYSYFNQKEFSKASHYFQQFIIDFKNDTRVAECNLRLADCNYGMKQYGKASIYYEKALVNTNNFKDDDRSYFNYAQALFKNGSSSKAISVLENLQLNFPASKYADDSQYLIGWIYFQEGKFENAIESYNTLIEKYNQSMLLPIAQYSIGDSYFNVGNYPNAINSYRQIISQFPNSSYVYDAVSGIQYCYIIQDKQGDAITFLENFIDKNPNYQGNDKIQLKKGEIYYSSADYNAAIREYDLLVNNYSESPLVPEANYWMGKSYVHLNNVNSAKGFFQNVINRSVNTEIGFNSILELGKLLRTENNLEGEIELYNKVQPNILDQKRIAEIKFIKAQAFIDQGNIAEAYVVLNEIVDQRDGSLFYHKAEIELGVLELSRGNFESSLFLLEDVTKNREDDIAAQAQYYIGLNYFEQERLPEAITELIKVRSLYSAFDEWYTKSLILLGDCYVKINDKANAAEMYKAVLKRHKNNPIAKEVNEKLRQL